MMQVVASLRRRCIDAKLPRNERKRGRFVSATDYICACSGNAFKLDMYPAFLIFLRIGSTALLPCLVYLTILGIPLIALQTFLGQFSSSGFITAFRMCPLFKGIGFASLIINFISILYSIIFATVPFYFVLNSFRTVPPWLCENINGESNNSTLCFDRKNDTDNNDDAIASVGFLRLELGLYDSAPFTFSWRIFLCGTLIWAIVGLILCISAESMGRFFRFGMYVIAGLLFTCMHRFMCLEEAWLGVLRNFFDFDLNVEAWLYSPFIIVSILGPGWGSIISLSSYTHFKSNILKNSWLIVLGQLSLTGMLGLIMFLTANHFEDFIDPNDGEIFDDGENWLKLFWNASALYSMDFASFWSILFFLMLTFAGIFLLVVQLFSLLTAVFDEFEGLRLEKQKIIMKLIGSLAVLSTFFYTNIGLEFQQILAVCILVTQCFFNFLTIIVVLFIFGRERFQKDFQFMTEQAFATWKIYILRIVITLFNLALAYFFFANALEEENIFGIICASFLVFLPWLLIPVYAVHKESNKTGSIKKKLKQCTVPKFWYPIDQINQRKYEIANGVTATDVGNDDSQKKLTRKNQLKKT